MKLKRYHVEYFLKCPNGHLQPTNPYAFDTVERFLLWNIWSSRGFVCRECHEFVQSRKLIAKVPPVTI